VRSLRRLTLVPNLLGVLVVTALAACSQMRDVRVTDGATDPRWTEDPHWRQVDLDVAAIINSMALAHGTGTLALMPER
jgi:hypothetical protein